MSVDEVLERLVGRPDQYRVVMAVPAGVVIPGVRAGSVVVEDRRGMRYYRAPNGTLRRVDKVPAVPLQKGQP